MDFVTLGSIASIKGGKRLPAGVSLSQIENDHPYIRVRDLNNIRMLEKTSDIEYVDDETQKSIARYIVDKGDIVISIVGTIGLIAIVGDSLHHANLTENCVRLTDISKDYDSLFLYYYLASGICQDEIKKSTVGAVQPKLPLKNIAMIPVPKIDLQTQKRIARILSSLDDKIELNNQINRNLEEQAKAIFKSWFVDFEPFQDGEFVDSELGIIPDGFKIFKNAELPIFVTDYVANGSFATLKTNVKLYQEQNFAYFIRNTDLKSGSFEVFVDKHSYDFLSKTKLFGGEIIISNVGDVGSVFLCPVLDRPMTLGNNIIMLRPETAALKYYLYILFKWFGGQDLIQSIKGGSAQPKFNKTDFKSLPVLMPPASKQQEFHSLMSPIFQEIENLNKQSLFLSNLRNNLLPKLMSGEMNLS